MNPVSTNPQIMHGVPCFSQTRVPVKTLFDYLAHNHPIEEFLLDFPTVSRDQVLQVIAIANVKVEATASGNAA